MVSKKAANPEQLNKYVPARRKIQKKWGTGDGGAASWPSRQPLGTAMLLARTISAEQVCLTGWRDKAGEKIRHGTLAQSVRRRRESKQT